MQTPSRHVVLSFLFLAGVACGPAATTNSGGGSGGATSGSGGAASGGAMGSGGATSATGGSDSAGGGATGGTTGGGPHATFYVEGRHLYDRCGEQVVLRGVNEMIVWSSGKDGVPEYEEIAKTGANSVRIVWNEEGSAAELDAAITNAVAHDLIPMVEHHSATGDLGKVSEVVDWWVQEGVVNVLKKHEPYLLLNIANEAGDGSVVQANFTSTYETAITRLRATGLVLPLIIDAPNWGQDIDMLQATGPQLLAHDPEKNVLFSVHTWWHDPAGAKVVTELQQSVDMGLPLLVGEFSQHAVHLCDEAPFGYTVLMAEAEKHDIGWLAWSWGGVQNNDCKADDKDGFNMTTNGMYGSWNSWGEVVAVTDSNSIQNTSVRPASMVNGSCD